MAEEKKSEKKPSTVKKVLTVVLDVFIVLFVIFAVLMTVLAFAAQSSSDGVPSIGGKCILTVQTDSMSPTFDSGDIIIGQKLSEADAQKLEVGDVISFDAGDLDGDGQRDINSHRIIEIVRDPNGYPTYKTKGDNNTYADESNVNYAYVISKWTGTRLPKVGNALNFLQSSKGFLIVIVIPLFLFFLFELFNFIRKLLQVREVEKGHLSEEEEDAIKKEAIAEYLRQQAALKAQEGGGEPKAPEGEPAAPEQKEE